mmetsp:Transcript_78851/g.218117  ORF Transcript_78851/g.218117 Transcript_78851/m.218117 type:complete len:229 (+) Transcript_78851:86-772(+)
MLAVSSPWIAYCVAVPRRIVPSPLSMRQAGANFLPIAALPMRPEMPPRRPTRSSGQRPSVRPSRCRRQGCRGMDQEGQLLAPRQHPGGWCPCRPAGSRRQRRPQRRGSGRSFGASCCEALGEDRAAGAREGVELPRRDALRQRAWPRVLAQPSRQKPGRATAGTSLLRCTGSRGQPRRVTRALGWLPMVLWVCCSCGSLVQLWQVAGCSWPGSYAVGMARWQRLGAQP